MKTSGHLGIENEIVVGDLKDYQDNEELAHQVQTLESLRLHEVISTYQVLLYCVP